MSQRITLADTLRMTNSLVGAIRRAIAEGGHIDAMHEIDALLGIAQSESERCLAEVQAGISAGSQQASVAQNDLNRKGDDAHRRGPPTDERE